MTLVSTEIRIFAARNLQIAQGPTSCSKMLKIRPPPIQAIQIHQSKRFRATCFSGTSDTKSRHLATLIRLALRLHGGKLHHCHLGKGSVGGLNH